MESAKNEKPKRQDPRSHSSARPSGPRPAGSGPARQKNSKYGNRRSQPVARGSRHNLVTNFQNGSKKPEVVDRTPRRARLKMIPLGGLGKMNKNLMVYEYDDPRLPNGGDIIIVDMGMAFPESDMHGIDYLIPDISYLRDKINKIRGILITHGHEDHIGALPHLVPEMIGVPIFGTKMSAGLIEKKFAEYHSLKAKKVQVIDSEEILRLGVFRVEPFKVAHSVPGTLGFGLYTPYGLVMHISDFRIDDDPIDDWKTDLDKIERMCKQAGGALLLSLDSTRIDQPGRSLPSRIIEETFVEVFGKARGRIIIAAFASQIARIQQTIWAAERYNRKIAISGRSMQANFEIASELGYLKYHEDMIVDINDIKKYPDDKIIVISTGSQGQQNSALMRMSLGEHNQVDIKKTDTIILSSSPIPGNEEAIYSMMDDLLRMGPRVIHNKEMAVHVTGHGFYDEIEQVFRLVKPKYYVPAHGDFHHLADNRNMALKNGMSEENIFLVEDGAIIELTENEVKISPRKVPSGTVMVDGLGVGDIGNIVLRDRQAMAAEGLFVVITTVSKKTGDLVTSPDIISRGFVYMRESEKLIHGARAEIKKVISERTRPTDWKAVKEIMRDNINKYLYKNTKRRPMVIPVVIEV